MRPRTAHGAPGASKARGIGFRFGAPPPGGRPTRSASVSYPAATFRFTDIEVLIEGDDALATFTRNDTFTDAKSGREMRLEVRISSSLVKEGGRWKIKSLQKPS